MHSVFWSAVPSIHTGRNDSEKQQQTQHGTSEFGIADTLNATFSGAPLSIKVIALLSDQVTHTGGLRCISCRAFYRWYRMSGLVVNFSQHECVAATWEILNFSLQSNNDVLQSNTLQLPYALGKLQRSTWPVIWCIRSA